MPIDKPYLDVPGTTVFDADQSRKGYWLNQFCMSLMDAGNRFRFKADERAYLDEWEMSEEQKQAVLDRDMNRMISLGGNIYFLAKIGATDGRSFQQMASSMTGMSEEEYRQMMVDGGRPIEGNRHSTNGRTGVMARSRRASTAPTCRRSASPSTRGGPASRTGSRCSPATSRRGWIREHTPDVVFLVYNDHATAFGLDIIPTFAIGTAGRYRVADEGWGPRPVPDVVGHPELAAHIAQRHPRRLRPDPREQARRRPRAHRPALAAVRPARRVAVPGDPVRGERRPVPGPVRPALPRTGRSIRRGHRVVRRRLDVQIWGTGGMSHQLHGPAPD